MEFERLLMRLHWHRRDLRTADNPGLDPDERAELAPEYPAWSTTA